MIMMHSLLLQIWLDTQEASFQSQVHSGISSLVSIICLTCPQKSHLSLNITINLDGKKNRIYVTRIGWKSIDVNILSPPNFFNQVDQYNWHRGEKADLIPAGGDKLRGMGRKTPRYFPHAIPTQIL